MLSFSQVEQPEGTHDAEATTLRLVMADERAYHVQVLEDGSEVRLRRRA